MENPIIYLCKLSVSLWSSGNQIKCTNIKGSELQAEVCGKYQDRILKTYIGGGFQYEGKTEPNQEN